MSAVEALAKTFAGSDFAILIGNLPASPLPPSAPNSRATPSRLLKKGRLPLTLNCESDSYANKGMAGGIDARFGYADG